VSGSDDKKYPYRKIAGTLIHTTHVARYAQSTKSEHLLDSAAGAGAVGDHAMQKLSSHTMNLLFEPSAEKAANASGRWRTNPSHRILMVGADSRILRLSAQVLVRSGYQMDAAEDGEDGWEGLHTRSYDLLITDNNMPRLTGLELVKKLRFARMTLPVIMASGSLGIEELNRNQWLQFAAVLLKPFTMDRLLAIVEEVLYLSGGVHTCSGTCLPLPVDALSSIQPTSHWGINE